MSFASTYRRLRTGKTFLIVLSTIIAAWFMLNWWFGFDPDYTRLNLCLSIEASVSVALLLAAQEAQDRVQLLLEQQTHDIVERVAQRLGIDPK